MKWKKWLSVIGLGLEVVLIIGTGYKLVSIQQNYASEIRNLWEVEKHLYRALHTTSEEERKGHLEKVEKPYLWPALGTQIMHCKIPPDRGYPIPGLTVEGLDAQVPILLTGRIEPCPETWITTKQGTVGRLERAERSSGRIDGWFLVVGILLLAVKVMEHLFKDEIVVLSRRKIRKLETKK